METDWIYGALGGLMIGLAGALYLLANGRIMGASGILGGLLDGSERANWAERGAFLAGLVLVPFLLAPYARAGETHITSNVWAIVAAGLLVGLGTRIANGCTSGHGVCGIARLSLRGIVATILYVIAGGAALYVFRHLLGIV
jgi:hypothetical protein